MTLTEGYSEVILVLDTYKSDSLKEKQEKDDKEKLLYSTRLQMIQASNMFHFHDFCHMKKQKLT